MMRSIQYWMMAAGAFALFYVYTLASTWLGIWPSKKDDAERNAKVRKGSLVLMAVAVVAYGGLYYYAMKKKAVAY